MSGNKAIVVESWGDCDTDAASGLNRARTTPSWEATSKLLNVLWLTPKKNNSNFSRFLCAAVVDHPVPSPGAGEVLVRLNLRPINPSDVFSLCGLYQGFKPESLPAIPGLEGIPPPPTHPLTPPHTP